MTSPKAQHAGRPKTEACGPRGHLPLRDRNDEVEARRREPIFGEAVKALCKFCLTLLQKNLPETLIHLLLKAGNQPVILCEKPAGFGR